MELTSSICEKIMGEKGGKRLKAGTKMQNPSRGGISIRFMALKSVWEWTQGSPVLFSRTL